MKKLIILAIGISLVILNQRVCFSYFGPGVGARALGMGGAFVSVAEGIDACYWNPAGLGNMKESEITMMRTMNNRDITEYQEWLAAGTKIGDSGGIGVNYAHFKNAFYWVEKKTNKFAPYTIDDEWVGLAVGGYGGGQFKNVAFGVNLRNRNSSLLTGTSTAFKWSECETTGRTADFIEYDVGILYRVNKEFSIGLIIQNYNEPIVNYGEDSPMGTFTFRWEKHITSGVSWRPDEKTVFAIECYNITLEDVYTVENVYPGAVNKPIGERQSQVRIGFERWCTDKIAVRAGLLSKDYHTAGFGIRGVASKRFFPGVQYDVDYALLEGSGVGTHFLSCTARF